MSFWLQGLGCGWVREVVDGRGVDEEVEGDF